MKIMKHKEESNNNIVTFIQSKNPDYFQLNATLVYLNIKFYKPVLTVHGITRKVHSRQLLDVEL